MPLWAPGRDTSGGGTAPPPPLTATETTPAGSSGGRRQLGPPRPGRPNPRGAQRSPARTQPPPPTARAPPRAACLRAKAREMAGLPQPRYLPLRRQRGLRALRRAGVSGVGWGTREAAEPWRSCPSPVTLPLRACAAGGGLSRRGARKPLRDEGDIRVPIAGRNCAVGVSRGPQRKAVAG